MPRVRLPLVTLAALALLVGCDSGSTGPSYVTTADSAELTFLGGNGKEMLLDELSLLNSQFPASGGLAAPYDRADAPRVGKEYLHQLLAGWAREGITIPAALLTPPSLSSPYLECVPTITGVDSNGVAIDSDNDGIPDDYKLDYGSACVSEDSAGTLRSTQSGSFRLQDIDNGFFSYGVTLDHERIKVENLATGAVQISTVNGFESASFADTGAHRLLVLDGTAKLVAGANVHEHSGGFVRRVDFTADTGGVLTLGGSLPAGTLTFVAERQEVNAFDGRNYSYFIRTPVSLHFVPGCAYQFDAGSLRGILNRNEAIGFQFTWSGCAQPTLDIFGDTTVPSALQQRP